jgi:hypothetical protein
MPILDMVKGIATKMSTQHFKVHDIISRRLDYKNPGSLFLLHYPYTTHFFQQARQAAETQEADGYLLTAYARVR